MTSGERGSALVEAIFLCILLLVPVAWGLAVLDQVHRAALASTSAVRDAGAEAVRAPDIRTARIAIDRAVADALRDQGLEPRNAKVRWSAADGLNRGSRVDVAVTYTVDVLGSWFPFAKLSISAQHARYVSSYASRDA